MNRKKEFAQVLFRWFKKYKRDLPWRHTTDPYEIFVSEMMLQQTQVERVLIKYRKFLIRFPTVEALAKASLSEVLRVWSGLGYNRRAKYVHDAAKIVVEKYKGKFPIDFDVLQTLPGIGRSTAAALCAFAFGADEPMIDTNIRRILRRIFFKDEIPSDQELYEFARMMIPKGRGRDWNWAMMDIGATLCTARHHDDCCPFQKLHGKVDDFVYKKPQKKFKDSDRYYRGKIIAALHGNNNGERITTICDKVKLAHGRCESIIGSLVKDGLLECNEKKIRIPWTSTRSSQ